MEHELDIDFEKGNESRNINPMKYKDGIIKYIKRANCPVIFTGKELSCKDAISAIEDETPEGIAICERVISDALESINNLNW